uniref:(northern house mosquito) hypothetical protein n=1 Tax=Culex pipiens TaxID=7175 RepID=A0A8D8C7C7_CULPI
MQHLSILTAGWSYIPTGLMFGYLLMLPIPENATFVGIYRETMFWPFIVAIITLIISVALTNGLKLNYRKCQFVHLYIQLVGQLFYVGAGLIFLLVKDVIPAIYLGACGFGLTIIPGLSYIHIRAPGRWRSIYMALCYFWFLTGVAGAATMYLIDVAIWTGNSTINETIHTNFSTCLLAGSCFVIVLLAINEMLQREGIVDYKKPLDFDTDIAHESGKLLTRREPRNLFNNFTSPNPATLTNGGGAKQWNSSTEQIIMDTGHAGKNFHTLWVFYMIFTKLQGFIAFYWVFVVLGIQFSPIVFENTTTAYSIFWFMVAGSSIGVFSMFFVNNKILFIVASIGHTVGLILAVAFYYTESELLNIGIALIVFFTFIGVTLAIPAINILELASLNFNEFFLAVGSILELIGIALIQYFGATNPSSFGLNPDTMGPADNHKEVIAAHFIAMIVLSVVLQVIVLWHMPNTFQKTLAEINSDLARMTSYFAFRRTMVPITTHAAMNRAFTESIASEQPDVEEKQLSTRNGHLATRFNDRSDEQSDRRSPYNDFSENSRYVRQTIVERAYSPSPDRDDPYLQEQLQRQHERNYIMSRQQHYQHHPRNSPEPQQYNYLPERQSEHPFQQRYNPEYDDRPRSNASQQQNRYTQGPPLLSRQQYYEQYSHDRTPPPIQPKPPSVRQTPTPPVDSQPTLAPLARRPQQSQTVKSEPGYVSRPRLETQKSEAPAPPPMPPADYLTKSLPRIKPDRPSRESIHPVLMLNAKPARPQEEIIPGVEYAHNLRPSEFLRQSRQLSQYRDSTMAI